MSLVALDLEFTRTNLDQDCALIQALMQIAVEDLRSLAIDLRSALNSRETEQVRRLAHAIKGLAANFRAEPLTQLTSQLEKASHAWDELLLQQVVDEVSTACECTVLALISELQTMNRAKVRPSSV